MPPLNELMDMLMSYVSRILKPMNQNSSSNQVAYVVQKVIGIHSFLMARDRISHHRIEDFRILLSEIKMNNWSLLNQNPLRKKCLPKLINGVL